MTPKQSQETQLALIAQNVGNIQNDVKDIKETLKEDYVSYSQYSSLKDRVDLIQRAIFFLVGILVVGVLGAVFRLVFR